MTTSSPDHRCLRPAFTRQLAANLSAGSCINLISPHGQGRRRTLADLHSLLTESMRIIQANLRDYPHSAEMLQADLCRQAGYTGSGLGELSEILVRSDKKWLIILHNIDELHPGNGSGFHDSFFNTLNTVAKLPAVALLCVSEHSISDWPLSTEPLPLPPLSIEQLLAETSRRDLTENKSELEALATWLAQQPAPYSLLDEAAEQLLARQPWNN